MADLVVQVRGGSTTIDAEDLHLLNGRKWRIDTKGYVACFDDKVYLLLHRLVNKTPDGFDTDHRDGVRTNNVKRNLRTLTRSQNTKNRSMSKSNTSGYTGVKWNTRSKKWLVYITVDYRAIYLGGYLDKEKASLVYQQAAAKHFGTFNRAFNEGIFG